nr:sulfotransferase family cytosolic 2B member 1-like [Pogona vitticeps]
MAKRTYFTYKGILLPTAGYSEESLSFMENEFQLLDDDVVTVSYPKSGTIWMLEILGLIWHDGNPSWVQSMISYERSPWIETVDGLKAALNYPPPRFLTTHLPFQLFPKSFLHSKCKIICLMRNPKDVLVSHYHFSKFFKVFEEPGTMEEFLEKFLNGNVVYGSWFDHVKGWMKLKERPNFFLITYEELQQDLRGSVKKICHFLGKELDSRQLDAVVKNASFEIMKDNKMSNFSHVPEDYMDHEKGKFMRKGVCGDWKNHLTVAQGEHFDRVYREKMQGVGVAFPWD